ncbi:N-acetyltransferase [Vibrio sp. CAU 1672]|uniref:GNAT family N-acetyltransferase n=1 Tax=Vibrio sp. CAU 1672 TaxID=3032594 RepID=UPI0023DA74A2|nr:N-acetyltransferase [Vibrio sp. CAU 1672]MDF2153381.1 N-acetyltransferase [Vibrio sp. CAU 1672]
MQIACATKKDLSAIFELESSLFGGHAYPRFFFRQAYDCWRQGLLVARANDTIMGYVLVVNSDEPGVVWVLSLAVDTHYRGQGIARQLMIHAISSLPANITIKLTVDPANVAALALYESLGFYVVAKGVNYFGDEEIRVVMVLKR